jgi:CRISPR-associated protein Cas2
MLVVVTYDVNTETPEGRRRLRQVAKLCSNHGQRVQKSVFECLLEPAQWTMLRHQLTSVMNPEVHSFRFYFLGANWKRRVEHAGTNPGYDPEGPLII